MEILSYFDSGKPEWWREKIRESDWPAAQFLHRLLMENRFHEFSGENAELLLLVDGNSLVSFCTYGEKDGIPDTGLAPWIGFVYTFPRYRGQRMMGKLFSRIRETARESGLEGVYICTREEGLYEKYGAKPVAKMLDLQGEPSSVFRMDTYGFAGWERADVRACSGEYPGIVTPKDLYNALWHVWSAETCAPRMRTDWNAENRTLGQCSVTAFLAQDIFGGKVYGIPLEDGGFHCYNAVGDCVFDLTSEQFPGKNLEYSNHPEQLRNEHFRKEEKRVRYEKLRENLKMYTVRTGKTEEA